MRKTKSKVKKKKCVNAYGRYDNMIVLPMPNHMKFENGGFYIDKHKVQIDPCIAEEIQMLWRHGVHTYASCCGHGIGHANVIVDKKSIGIMESLGYEKSAIVHPGNENCQFRLKSKHVYDYSEKTVRVPNRRRLVDIEYSDIDCLSSRIDFYYSLGFVVDVAFFENDKEGTLHPKYEIKIYELGYEIEKPLDCSKIDW